MAIAASQVSPLEDGLQYFLDLAKRRHLAEDSRHLCRPKSEKPPAKKSTPTVAIIDSQSIRTAEESEKRGCDSAKKLTGRKRHIAVETLGLLLSLVVQGAHGQDYEGARWVLKNLHQQFRRIRVVFGDETYRRGGLPEWVEHTFGWILQTVLKPVGVKSFVVLPKRWIAERTFAWLARYR